MEFRAVCATCKMCDRKKYETPALALGNPKADTLVIYDDVPLPFNFEPELEYIPYVSIADQAAINAAITLNGNALAESLQVFGNIDECLFTTSLRCSSIEGEALENAYTSCGIYTRSLIDGRKIIVTTLKGLSQFSNTLIEKAEEWKTYGTIKGFVFVIPPFESVTKADMKRITTEMARLRSEVGRASDS